MHFEPDQFAELASESAHIAGGKVSQVGQVDVNLGWGGQKILASTRPADDTWGVQAIPLEYVPDLASRTAVGKIPK